MGTLSRWLKTRYPSNCEWDNSIRTHTAFLLRRYKKYADSHFLHEFCSGKEDTFRQRYWEMFLGCWLIDNKLELLPHQDKGPDFAIKLADRNILIEAIAPTIGDKENRVPEIKPTQWGQAAIAQDVPLNQILLRWTTAFQTKAKIFNNYITQGTVSSSDICIIAINSCQLGSFAFTGISSYPTALETVYPVGPRQAHIPENSTEKIRYDIQYRPQITKANKTTILTTPFLSSEYTHISALLATHTDERGGNSPIILIHNLNAKVPLTRGAIPVETEYWVELNNTDLKICHTNNHSSN